MSTYVKDGTMSFFILHILSLPLCLSPSEVNINVLRSLKRKKNTVHLLDFRCEKKKKKGKKQQIVLGGKKNTFNIYPYTFFF